MTLRSTPILSSRAHKSGQAPGTLLHVGERPAEPTRVRAMDYEAGQVDERPAADLAEVERLRRTPAVTWLDVIGLGDTTVLEQIGAVYGVHPLILEDILNTDQRPKLEVFDDYLFLSAKMIDYDEDRRELTVDHFSAIVGRNFAITFQPRETGMLESVRTRLRNPKGRLCSRGPDLLVHAALDAILDHYFAVLERVGERLEDLEDHLVAVADRDHFRQVHDVKRDLLLLRRSMWPLREVINGLMRTETDLVRHDTMPYLRDLHDHAIEVIDTLEILRDMASGLVELYLSSLSHRMNEAMRVLTVIATIFIPLTFITSLYGMNFEHMPELRMPWAYPAVLATCAALGAGMLIAFRRRRWV